MDDYIRECLSTDIRLGYYDGVRSLLATVPVKPAAALLGVALHDVLDAGSFASTRNFGQHGGNLSVYALPATAQAYELNLKKTVRLLAAQGADFQIADEAGCIPAQRCFNNANDDRGTPANAASRFGACVEIVRQTLQQQPNWKPDIQRLFADLSYKKDDKEADGHRRDVSRFANTLGQIVARSVLLENNPAATELRLRMSANTLTYWKNGGWLSDPDDMPWMDHAKLQGKPLRNALDNSGLTFAFGATGTSVADAAIAQARASAKGKLPPPVAG